MADDIFDLRLYVAGQTPKAIRAFANLQRICDEHLEGRYRIEVIDLLEDPQLGRGDQILALPTLVRRLPHPIKKIIGDLSNTERVLVADGGGQTERVRTVGAPPLRQWPDPALDPRGRDRPGDLRGAPAGPLRAGGD